MALKTQSYKYKDYRIDVQKKKDYCLQLKIYIKIQPRYYYFTGVYITNKKLHDLLEIRNFSFCVQKPSFRISARPCNILYMYIYLLCPIGKHSWLSALLQIWNCAMIYGLCRSTFLTALFSRPFVGKDCVRLQFKGDCVSKRNIISWHMHHHVFLQTFNSA